MPTCSNQSGYNSAVSACEVARISAEQQAQANYQMMQGGGSVPGANAAGWTPTMCYGLVTSFYQQALGRTPTTPEAQPWAEGLYGFAFNSTGLKNAIVNSAECYARFGCS